MLWCSSQLPSSLLCRAMRGPACTPHSGRRDNLKADGSHESQGSPTWFTDQSPPSSPNIPSILSHFQSCKSSLCFCFTSLDPSGFTVCQNSSPWDLESNFVTIGLKDPQENTFICRFVVVFQLLSCVWLCHPMDCSIPGSSILHCLLGVCSDSRPLSPWCHPTILSFAAPFSFAFDLSQHQGVFQWVPSSH